MSDTYQQIDRGDRYDGKEALCVADEADHVQWIRLADLEGVSQHRKEGEWSCDECAEVHFWRKVYVKV